MEQPEEKKRKGHRRIKRRPQSKSTSSLPLDLAPDIFSKLPAKSVVKFRCVSKLCSSITKEPYFINSFETHSSTRPKLLFCFKKRWKIFVFSIPQPHQNLNEYYTSQVITDRYHMKFPGFYSPTESVHGLICFQKSGNPIVWNPSMGQYKTLPKPSKVSTDLTLTIFLGYDPIEGKHKVVCLPLYETCSVYRVLTLGSNKEIWRRVKTNIRHRSLSDDTYGRCINGVLYYRAYIEDLDSWGIMSFDVRSEKCHMIQLPSDIDVDMLITYEGKLACVKRYPATNELLILEDAEEQEWSSKHFRIPFAQDDPRNIYKLSGITLAGEFVYTPYTFHKPFYIYYYDPKRNNSRKIEFKGITDDEFWLGNGLEDLCSSYTLHTFVNHFERLTLL